MSQKVAIVGAGPSGCYLAQSLVKASPDLEVTMIDRLCVPYGLVRYGVAPDHQGTKAVTRQFSRLFEKQGVTFMGNIDVGTDLSLDDLREAMDAVILAPGLYADRALKETSLAHIYGAGAVTRFWNGHPDAQDMRPKFGKSVVVFGNGNVAMDLVRLLAKTGNDFDGSDFDSAHVNDDVEEIHVIGRGDLEEAKFDTVMIKELAGLEDVSCTFADGATVGDGNDPAKCDALRDLFAKDDSAQKTKQLTFHNGWSLESFGEHNNSVASVELKSNAGDATKTIGCDSVITAIGFDDDSDFDRNNLLENARSAPDGIIGDGLFVAGWFKRGPKGTIPENRVDSQAVATHVLAWLNEKTAENKPGYSALLAKVGHKATTYADWKLIDEVETTFSPSNRVRRKIVSHDDMLATIHKKRQIA